MLALTLGYTELPVNFLTELCLGTGIDVVISRVVAMPMCVWLLPLKSVWWWMSRLKWPNVGEGTM